MARKQNTNEVNLEVNIPVKKLTRRMGYLPIGGGALNASYTFVDAVANVCSHMGSAGYKYGRDYIWAYNGYNEDKLQRAPSVYSLDAFYAAESRNKSAIMLSGNEFNTLLNKAPNEFATEFMDQPQARIAIIRSLERSNPSAFTTDDDGNSYTILDVFMPIHQTLLARGR